LAFDAVLLHLRSLLFLEVEWSESDPEGLGKKGL
jgi:hypothetical protein